MATKRAKSSKRKGTRARFNLLPWLIGAAVVLLIVVPVVLNIRERRSGPGEFFASQGNAHIALGSSHPAYNSNPPTSGWHTPDLVSWGSYDYEVPDERLIHNMEDGGVILWYRMGTPEENEARIRELEEASQGYRRVVIAPRSDLDTQYALTAWTRLDKFDTFDAARVDRFLNAYEGIDHHVAGVG